MTFSLLRRQRDLPGQSTDGTSSVVRWGRWAGVLLAVLVLHWVAVHWVDRNKNVSNPSPAEHVPVQVELLTPKPVAPAPVPVVKPAPKAVPKPAPPPPPPTIKPSPAGSLSLTSNGGDNFGTSESNSRLRRADRGQPERCDPCPPRRA